MHIMRLPLDELRIDPANKRQATEPADIETLAISLQIVGQLQPIIVRPNPDPDAPDTPWLVTAGAGRVAAARHLGWAGIEAIEMAGDVQPVAVSAAENFVRRAMRPVEQWRALVALRDEGHYRIENAAAALGLDLRLARRLTCLGDMDPAVIACIERYDTLPPYQALRTIAMAPKEVQRAAVAQTREPLDWHAVATACRCQRIPRSRAVFDVATAAIAFEEDLFAEPDSDEQFTTTDIDGFLAAQFAAIEAEARASKGRITVLPGDATKYLRDRLPKDWHLVWDTVPKRWKKDDPRRVFVSINLSGYYLGTVERVLAAPKRARGAVETSETQAAPARPAVTKMVQAHLAERKGEAVRERLPVFAQGGPRDMLRALVLVFACRNVRNDPSVARALIDPSGRPRAIDDPTVCDLAATIIGDLITFDRPDVLNSSGPGAEWLATLTGAAMPRCDTAEILRGFSLEKLSEIAIANGLPGHGTATALRKRMTDAMPDWRPVTFGAPGPRVGADADIDGAVEDVEPRDDDATTTVWTDPGDAPDDAEERAA